MTDKDFQNQIIISKLLTGKVLDSLTDEEQLLLAKWENDPENNQIISNILNEKSFSKWKKEIENIDVDHHWYRFVNDMDRNRTMVYKLKFKRSLKWASAAAAMFALTFATVNYFDNPFVKKDIASTTVPISEVKIVPGTSQAVLILTDGKKINLKKATSQQISENGIVANTESGVLELKKPIAMNIIPAINTLQVPKGGEFQLVLSDGTKVWMNSDSELSFPSTFVGKERHVTLKGEAYFEVAHDKTKPFIVSTENENIKVLGTAFNVSSYKDTHQTTTTLVNGKIEASLFENKHFVGKEILTPNEQLVLKEGSDIYVKKNVDVYQYIAWKEGRFVFKNEPLEAFFQKIGRWYNVNIIITDDSLKSIHYTYDLPRYKNLESLLQIIEIEMSVNIRVDDNRRIFISKKGN